ncbi:transmembrane protein, putative [Medicago truncatula]|uniref:Transmembrane protein, putative n=1 Tax=Medicago truncatula TaxID=3880 RepID=G7KGU4_MEDTR|nr:transmembrane protein, putative [Medicago truncatula]
MNTSRDFLPFCYGRYVLKCARISRVSEDSQNFISKAKNLEEVEVLDNDYVDGADSTCQYIDDNLDIDMDCDQNGELSDVPDNESVAASAVSISAIYGALILFFWADYRVTSRKGLKILITDENGDCIDNTTNVVYKEVFQNV